MDLIDTHTHIYDEAFDEDRIQAVERAKEAGISKLLMPAIDSESHGRMFVMARAYPGYCLPMMGVHPTSVNGNAGFANELELAQRYLKNPPVGIDHFWAVGECGLDLYWSKDFLADQIEALRFQIELALMMDLPLVIHTRDAWPEMKKVLSDYRGAGLRAVLHSFSGSIEDAQELLSMGDLYFGIGGVLTFKNGGLGEVAAQLPMDRIVLETDAPYLTPVPFRGKRNESSYLVYVAAKLAEIFAVEEAEIARITTLNAQKLFAL